MRPKSHELFLRVTSDGEETERDLYAGVWGSGFVCATKKQNWEMALVPMLATRPKMWGHSHWQLVTALLVGGFLRQTMQVLFQKS